MKYMTIGLIAALLSGCTSSTNPEVMKPGSKKETLSRNSVKGMYLLKIESNTITIKNGSVSL